MGRIITLQENTPNTSGMYQKGGIRESIKGKEGKKPN
jgi:hypothetical protein